MSALTPTWSMIAAVLVAASVGVFWWFLGERHDETPSWLFSQTAHSGSPQDKGDGTVVLTLNDIDAHTIGFTDRPDRDSAMLMTQDFVE